MTETSSDTTRNSRPITRSRRVARWLSTLLLLAFMAPIEAHADCTSPAGVEADMFYNTTHKRVQYCDGTNWVNMGVSSLGSSDNLGNHTATQALAMGGFNITGAGAITGTSFTGVGTALTALSASNLGSGTVPSVRLGTGTANATTYLRGDGTWATPTVTETDPKVGAVTNGQWCRGSGTQVICDQAAPGGGTPTCTLRTATNSGITTISVSCLAGEILTGGGGTCATLNEMRSSFPNPTLTTWTTTCAGSANSVSARAICCTF